MLVEAVLSINLCHGDEAFAVLLKGDDFGVVDGNDAVALFTEHRYWCESE